ncbi:MAG: hypothetical protein IKO98_02905, partial [Bacteroidales bacterium]|nr:hypothetical protein [Bacteroidales bacterium]
SCTLNLHHTTSHCPVNNRPVKCANPALAVILITPIRRTKYRQIAEQGSEQAGGVVWKDIKQNMIR